MLEKIDRCDPGLQPVKVREYFDYDSSRFADNRWLGSRVAREDYRVTRDYILHFLDIEGTDDVLEVGCGPGVWTDLVSSCCHRVTAVDISGDMLENARSRVVRQNVTFRQADFADYRDTETYDKILSVRAIEYFTDPAQAVHSMYALMKDGGRTVVVTKTHPTLITVRAGLWRRLRGLLRAGRHAQSEPPLPMRKIQPFRLRHMFLECGYRNVDVYPVVLRSPLFIHGRYPLPWFGERTRENYETSMLRFLARVAASAKSKPKLLRYVLLMFSETYLIVGEK